MSTYLYIFESYYRKVSITRSGNSYMA